MKNKKEIVKGIRNIWRSEIGNKSNNVFVSYNDKRGYGSRLKLNCNIWGMDRNENLKLRDGIILKIREYVNEVDKKERVFVDGWGGGGEICVWFYD